MVRRVLPLYNLTWIPFDYSLGAHATSVHHPTMKNSSKTNGDEFRLRYQYRALLQTQPEYARAICHLVLIDYVCLPKYTLPKYCQFLESIRSEGVRILTS